MCVYVFPFINRRGSKKNIEPSGFCVNPPNASPFVSSNRKIMTGCPTITASEKKPKSFGCREIRSDIPSTY